MLFNVGCATTQPLSYPQPQPTPQAVSAVEYLPRVELLIIGVAALAIGGLLIAAFRNKKKNKKRKSR